QNKYRTLIEAARFADTHDFAAIWLPERHFTFMGSLYPNPAVLHAALARETKRLRLRAGSVVLPLHDPIRVAEEWAVVDNLSAGRAGAHLLTHLFDQDVDELAVKIKLYRDARQQTGFDPQSGRVAVALHTYLADSMDDVLANAHGPYCAYLKTNVKLIEKLAQSRGIPLDISRL